MADRDMENGCEEITGNDFIPGYGASTCMTLENIIDFTGELGHLNELVMLHMEKSGGFTCTESYFSVVQPLLDMLEIEIRIRCSSGMTQQQIKLTVQDWIDEEIAKLRRPLAR